MEEMKNTSGSAAGFGSFAVKRMLPAVGMVIAAMAILWFVLQYFEVPGREMDTQKMDVQQQDAQQQDAEHPVARPSHVQEGMHTAEDMHATEPGHAPAAEDTHETEPDHAPVAADIHHESAETGVHGVEPGHVPADDDSHKADSGHAPVAASAAGIHAEPAETGAHAAEKQPASEKGHKGGDSRDHAPLGDNGSSHEPTSAAPTSGHKSTEESDGHAAVEHDGEALKTYPMIGMAFVDAVIQPMDYELNHRFFGWRPNDIIEYTDNVNNFQLAVLEVTRRTTRILAERISRTGSTARFDPNLENAMNWFMIKADRYWFPGAESKYQDGLKELRAYFDKLGEGQAEFYTRADNLIPLLTTYQDLLGSCDENLVKIHEADGSRVSFFQADNYFNYAKGVASTLHTILRAIEQDFYNIMVTREGSLEVLHHAIESCHHATEIEPWIVLNSGYSSFFANHRANIAAPISHARFYLEVLITALST